MQHVSIPEGRSGDYSIEKFIVTPEDAVHWFCVGVPPGTYTRLLQKGALLMSDTPDEWRDHSGFIYSAFGDVLINGLGLGMVVLAIQDRSNIRSIVINEISEDVIRLVGPSYQDHPKIIINRADAYTWKPEKGQRFDSIWHDIWGDVSTDALTEMARLNRRYAHWLAPGGFQGCWKKEWLQWWKRSREQRLGW